MKKDINELKSKIEELYQKGGGYLYVDNGIIIRVKDNVAIVYDAYFHRGWMLVDAEVIAAMVANWYLTQLMITVRYDKPMILPNGYIFDPTKLEKHCEILENLMKDMDPEYIDKTIYLEDYQEAKKGGPVGVYHLLVEKRGDRGMWLPCDWEGMDTLLENNWELTADYFIKDNDIPEDVENICSITGEIYKGYGNNAYPFYGRCSDFAYAKYAKRAYLLGYTREDLEEMKTLTPEQRNRALKETMDKCYSK